VGAEAGDFAALLVEFVDGAEGVADDVGDVGEAAGDGVLGDLHHAVFNLVEDVDSFEGLVGGLHHAHVADAHELAHEGFVADDADVGFDGELAGKAFGEGGEVGAAADGVEFLAFAEVFGDGDDVDGVADLGEVEHDLVDFAVGVEGEVVGFEEHGGVDDGEGFDEHGAEDGLLGVERGRAVVVVGVYEAGDGCHAVGPSSCCGNYRIRRGVRARLCKTCPAGRARYARGSHFVTFNGFACVACKVCARPAGGPCEAIVSHGVTAARAGRF